MADGKIEIEVVFEDGSIKKGFVAIEKQAGETALKVETTFKDKLKNAFAIEGVRKAVETLKGFGSKIAGELKHIIAAGSEAEVNLAKFGGRMRAAGFYSEEAANGLKELAHQLSETTKYSNDQIIAVEALSFNYSKSAQQSKELTLASIRLANATGTDVETAMQQLGGTMQGILGRTLPRLRGGFRDLTQEQLKNGDAIRLVNERFKDMLGAGTKTFSGILNNISKAWHHNSEVLGLAIVQNEKVKEALRKILETVRHFSTEKTIEYITVAIDILSVAFNEFVKIAEHIPGILKSISDSIKFLLLDQGNFATSIRVLTISIGTYLLVTNAVPASIALVALATEGWTIATTYLTAALRTATLAVTTLQGAATFGLSLALAYLINKAVEMRMELGSWSAVFLSVKISALEFFKEIGDKYFKFGLKIDGFLVKMFSGYKGAGKVAADQMVSPLTASIAAAKAELADLVAKSKEEEKKNLNKKLGGGGGELGGGEPANNSQAATAAFQSMLESNRELIAQNDAAFEDALASNENYTAERFNQFHEYVNQINAAGQEGFAVQVDAAKQRADEVAKLHSNIASTMQNITVGGIAAIGGALVNGKKSFKDFGKTVLGLLGSLAIQVGTLIAGMGKAIQALATALTNFFTAPFAIYAGLALIALGGALTALSSGGGGGGGSGGANLGAAGTVATAVTSEPNEVQDQGTQLVVNVQGSIFDTEETGLRISDIIKTNFDRKDVRFA